MIEFNLKQSYKIEKVEPDVEGEVKSVADELKVIEESESTESKCDTYQLVRDRKKKSSNHLKDM